MLAGGYRKGADGRAVDSLAIEDPREMILEMIAHTATEFIGCAFDENIDQVLVGHEGFEQGLFLQQSTVVNIVKNR